MASATPDPGAIGTRPSRSVRALCAVGLALAGAAPVGAQEGDGEAGGEGPEAGEEIVAPRWSATTSTRYRGRWGRHESDHDLTESVTFRYGDSRRDAWTLQGTAIGAYDLDGVDDGGADPFFSLQDTYDRATARLHTLHVDLLRIEGVERVRLGRQLLYRTPLTLHLDGVHVESAPLAGSGDGRVRVGGHAGVPVHPYESSPDGDLTIGLHASVTPWEDARLRVDWVHLEDQRRTLDATDDLYGVTLTQALEHAHAASDVELRHTRVGSAARDATLTLGHSDWEDGYALELRYHELFETQRDLAVPLDPFESTLFELFPFRELNVHANATLGDVLLQCGGDLRVVSDDDDEGEFNRDLERWFATTTVALGETELSVTGEVWRADDNDFETWGLDATRTFEGLWRGALRASVGSYYSLYKYDLFAAEELDRVRTYYTTLRHRFEVWPATALVRYELEDGDDATFHRATLGVTWSF